MAIELGYSGFSGTAPTAPSTPSVDSTGLTIQDLSLVLQIIQVSSARGAFRAEELSAIGGLHDRIFKFLEASGAISKTPGPNTPADQNNKEN